MTAATPAPERDDSGTPDGRTYSGPADAATPGQAAYEAFHTSIGLPITPESCGDWPGMDSFEQAHWEAAASAAIAAREPHAQPAPGLADAMAEAASRELAEAMRESRRFRDALQQVARHIDGDSTQARILARIAKRALEGK